MRLKQDNWNTVKHVKVLSMDSAIVMMTTKNPRYSYQGHHVLGPENWGTETQSDLRKITQQMSEWQSQPGLHQRSSQPISGLISKPSYKSASQERPPDPTAPRPHPKGWLEWHWIQWCRQSTKCKPGMCSDCLSNGNSTFAAATGPCTPRRRSFLPWLSGSHFEPCTSSFLSLDLRFSIG